MAHGNAGKGRKKGSRNKRTLDAQQVTQAMLSDPLYRANLKQRAAEGKLGAMEPVLWYYAYGKPVERQEHSGAIQLIQPVDEFHGV